MQQDKSEEKQELDKACHLRTKSIYWTPAIMRTVRELACEEANRALLEEANDDVTKVEREQGSERGVERNLLSVDEAAEVTSWDEGPRPRAYSKSLCLDDIQDCLDAFEEEALSEKEKKARLTLGNAAKSSMMNAALKSSMNASVKGGKRGSLAHIFNGSVLSTKAIMDVLGGRGGTSRMFARGKSKKDDLSSVGRFFSRGSTLERATAFTKSAIAFERNAGTSRSNQRSEPNTSMLDSQGEHPVQEMQFYNVGGAKVFFYYGLDTIRSPDHVMAAGPHVRDTAVGVLMLDQYKIQERPGDPSNPLSFWPYQTFYVIPQGITFEKCKTVGSAGTDALRDYPLETAAICQALLAVAEVASRNGYKKLMICGDCGYYSLAAEALAKSLSCWGTQSWVPHPDGAFASYRVPRFKSQSLDLDIVLSLGTTQLIASPKPEKNLSTRLGSKTSCVYLTADLRGWYGGEALKIISDQYMPYLHRPWNGKEWHFNLDGELSMLDLVAQVNSALLTGVVIQHNNDALYKMADMLLEIGAGSTAFLIGVFLGHMAASLIKDAGSTATERAFYCASKLTSWVKEMALDDDGTPHPQSAIVEKVAPFFAFIRPLLHRLASKDANPHESLTEEEEFRSLALLIGNPSCKGEAAPETYEEFKLLLALRIQDSFMSLLRIGELSPDVSGLPLGKMYTEFFANFIARINHQVLPVVKRNHGIDGRDFPLFDCRFVPGFGFQVAHGLTVWTGSQNYFWMGNVLLRFSEVMQEQGWMGAAAYHLECTELYSFTPFFHEMGIPVIDGVNMLILASRGTDAPMRFVCLKQKNGSPPTPSALVADLSSDSVFGVSYYRDQSMALRTPTHDSSLYKICSSRCRELLVTDKFRWSWIQLARPLYDDFQLKWGFDSYLQARPGNSIYPSSSALDVLEYIENGPALREEDYQLSGGESYVQYAPPNDEEEGAEEDFRSFFGGAVYGDQKDESGARQRWMRLKQEANRVNWVIKNAKAA